MTLDYLIDEDVQRAIATRIDRAVAGVISELPNHGSEEGITPVLGHALMKQNFETDDLSVSFNYRQTNKYTEERHSGADGGFLVKVVANGLQTQKAAIFQAKLIRGSGPTRQLTMRTSDARRLAKQASDMLSQTSEAVALFYTEQEIYVVDASHFTDHNSPDLRRPLMENHRLITLGTYLGRWIPRCTRGDKDPGIVTKVSHIDGFKHGLSMEVISSKPSVPWKDDSTVRRRRN